MANSMLDFALAYADAGLAVFPLRPHDKRPATANGFKDATRDPSIIEKWWTRTPDANIGIACGERSGGLVVLDFDVDEGKDGLDALHDWERVNGELPETVSAETGRGGMHLYYRAENIRNSANGTLGVDVRGEGGYVVAPPSLHPNGSAYAWMNDPDEYAIADADDSVLAFIEHVTGRRSSTKAAKQWQADEVAKGGRNDSLYKYVCSLLAKSVDREYVRPLAIEYNTDHCKPPLPLAEVEKTLHSALTRPDGHSAEVKAQAQAKKPDALAIFKRMVAERGACTIDGAPACRVADWHEIGFNAIDRAIYEIDERATLAVIRDVRHRIMVKAPKLKQSPRNLVGFTNGVLNVDDMTFVPWGEQHVIANVVPCEWNPDAKCPELDRMLERMACGNAAIMRALQEVLGAAIYRAAVGQMVILVNPGGSNGKSTFIKLCNMLAGPDNSTSIEFTELGHRFQAGMLAGKTLNTSDDVGGYVESASTGVLKKLITGDQIHTDVKGGDGFDFYPYVTLIVSANEMPRIADTSGGMTRRMFGIPFNAVFRRTDADYDPHIVDKIDTPEGLSRLAYHAIVGLGNLRAHNGFTPFDASEQLTAEIVEDNDPVRQFMTDCDHGLGWFIDRDTASAYDSYVLWTEKSGNKPMARRTFTKRVGTVLGLELVQRKVRDADGNTTKIRVFSAPESAVKVPGEGE